jgi:hypothetical protein
MSPRVIYPLQRSGNLLFLRASVNGTNGDFLRVRLLVDIQSIDEWATGDGFPESNRRDDRHQKSPNHHS